LISGLEKWAFPELSEQAGVAMKMKRRRFLAWMGWVAAGSLGMGALGCGGRGFSAGSLLQAPAQGSAAPPPAPSNFLMRNDLSARPRLESATGAPKRLLKFGQLSDVHITLEQFTFSGHPKLEKMLDGFGEEIGFGGLDRPDVQEKYDVDTLRAMVKTFNAVAPPLDFVVNTGDAVDIGTIPELVGFLSEMNQLEMPLVSGGRESRLPGNGKYPAVHAGKLYRSGFFEQAGIYSKAFSQQARFPDPNRIRFPGKGI
jgi:hypothetical protein